MTDKQKVLVTHEQAGHLAAKLAQVIKPICADGPVLPIYPIPRGGVPVVYLLGTLLDNFVIVDTPDEAALFIDDIIDSGDTMQKYCDEFPNRPFFALIDKLEPGCEYQDSWVVFPWENQDVSGDDSIVGTLTNRIQEAGAGYFANDNIAAHIHDSERPLLEAEIARRVEHLLQGLLIDTKNDHNTVGSAARIARMYLNEVFHGRYQKSPNITSFPNVQQLDEMYITGPITVRSACSHHFVPIIGRCWIGVIPGETVIGLSKFNRLVEWIASRPQIQEELVVQIADAIEKEAAPVGLAVVVEATHLCMTWRGVREDAGAKMTTNVMRGAFRDNEAARAEFMSLVTQG